MVTSCNVECAPNFETTVHVPVTCRGGSGVGGGRSAVAAFRVIGVVGKVASVSGDGGLAARGAADGGVGAIWRTGRGAGAGEVVSALLAGWRASGVGDRDDSDGEDYGDSDCGAIVSVDADAVVDNSMVPVDL